MRVRFAYGGRAGRTVARVFRYGLHTLEECVESANRTRSSLGQSGSVLLPRVEMWNRCVRRVGNAVQRVSEQIQDVRSPEEV